MTTGRSATSADGTWSVTVVHTSASARGSSTSEPSASRTGAVNAVSSSITSVRTSTARLCCASCTRSGTMATSSRLSGGSTTWSISPTASSSASPSTTRSSQRNCESSSFGSGIPPCALSGSSSACSAGSISRSAFATPACSGSTWSSSRTRLSFTASAPNPAARPPAGACIGTATPAARRGRPTRRRARRPARRRRRRPRAPCSRAAGTRTSRRARARAGWSSRPPPRAKRGVRRDRRARPARFRDICGRCLGGVLCVRRDARSGAPGHFCVG